MCLNIVTFDKYNHQINETDNESQIRIACGDRIITNEDILNKACHLTKYCEMDEKCKLYVPRDKYKFFVGMIVSEMLKYGKREYSVSGEFAVNISGRILDNTVNHIANLDNFIDSADGVFERKTPTENLLSKIRLNKDL